MKHEFPACVATVGDVIGILEELDPDAYVYGGAEDSRIGRQLANITSGWIDEDGDPCVLLIGCPAEEVDVKPAPEPLTITLPADVARDYLVYSESLVLSRPSVSAYEAVETAIRAAL